VRTTSTLTLVLGLAALAACDDSADLEENTAPVAEFTFECAQLACTFTDASSDADGSVASRQWDFGDGGTATSLDPAHTYEEPGTFEVTLTVTDNADESHTVTHSVTVGSTPNQPPAASFTVSCTNLHCAFTQTASDPDGSIQSYSWDFGDEGTATAPNPEHDYAAAGTFAVTLTVTDERGSSGNVTQEVTVGTAGVTQWTEIPFDPEMSGGRDLWAQSSTDLFVAANATEELVGPGSAIWRYDGQGWTAADAIAKDFMGIWGSSANNVYAAACNVVSGGDGGVWRFDGAEWSDVVFGSGPTDPSLNCFRAAWGSSASDVFAGGDRFAFETDLTTGFVRHFDGSTWTYAETPGVRVTGISGSGPTAVYAIDRSSACAPTCVSRSLLLHYDGASWSEAIGSIEYVFNGLWVAGNNEVWIAAERTSGEGVVLHYDGTGLTESFGPGSNPAEPTLLDIWGSSGSDIYAVGSGGILHYDGSTWVENNPTGAGRIWGTSASDLFVLTATHVLHGTP
jgi:PKD repeat protein